ncbi:hypothetical protein CYMTET_31931 [Cymbomonas tetramitiformis]|uniref:Uncharacterized protein n=1 Tax=Cymbomonas tetramitiformis TaxID=36881 RepID=A0AAE0KSF9_9CHLO|nr:hypothetical protein CYMTET_31931 [Cymbomonas tetramitiformis]
MATLVAPLKGQLVWNSGCGFRATTQRPLHHLRNRSSLPRPSTRYHLLQVPSDSFASRVPSKYKNGCRDRLGQRRSIAVSAEEKPAIPDRIYTSSSERPKVGFVGMGIMGVPMALNLLTTGYEVTVWNRTANKCTPVVEAGATYAASAKEVAEASDITFGMLADPEAALDVCTSPYGVAAGMAPGKGYVDVSTVDPATAKSIAGAIHASGGEFLEAPVSGSKKPAEDGQLIFLTAGDEHLYHAAVPMLEVMGKAHFFLGAVGKGAEMKLVVNMVMGSMMAAFAEGLELGSDLELPQETVLQVISLGAISSPMFSLKGPSMIQGKYPTAFPLKHQQKDMRLALSLGDESKQQLPVAAAANELYKEAIENHDLGDADFSAVLRSLQ